MSGTKGRDSGKELRKFEEDYKADGAKIETFLKTFKGDGDEPKYLVALEQISISKLDDLKIELDDIYNMDEKLGDRIMQHTDLYLRRFYAVADPMVKDFTNFGSQLDAINTTRYMTMKETNASDKFPPELFRRYTIRFIPPTKSRVTPMREVRADSIGCMVRVRGLVTRITQVKPLLHVAAYSCSQCSEETFKVIDTPTFLPRTTCESQQCKAAPRPGTLTLQTRGSKFMKFQVIKLQELANEVPAGHIPRTMTVYARENCTKLCQSGDVVDVDGVFLPMPLRGNRQSFVSETYIEAQDIRVTPKCGDIEDDGEELDGDEGMYDRLAATVAPEIYGHEDVKRSILLQLVGGMTRQFDDGVRIRGDINLCLMGDPGVAKSQLLKWVARVSPRAVYATGRGSSGVGLTAAVLRDPVTGEMALEGGALVLADMGICCIDEFDKMEDTDRTAIYEVMEQQTVSIAKAGINTQLNARTAILAAANPVGSKYNTKKTLLENVQLPAALLSRFDLMFLLLDRPTPESDAALANHIAFVHKNRKAPESMAVGLKSLRRRIETAKTFNPVIPNELSEYIENAYTAMRSRTEEEPVTPRQLLAVIRLAMALARIRYSDVVVQEDVEEALRLVTASKESVELIDKDEQEKIDKATAIYEKIREIAKDKQTISMEAIKKGVLQAGYTQADLDKTISMYENLGVWQLNPSKTKMRIISVDEE